jgi:hypothetical protein
MLAAMHDRVDSHDALAPLRDRYTQQYRSLVKFYEDCRNIRYLTSLITIPRLPPVCAQSQGLLIEDSVKIHR